MKILVIDFETTGLDIATCQILQFACMVLDTELEFPDSIDKHDIRSLVFAYPFITFKGNGLEAMLKNRLYAHKILTNEFAVNERLVTLLSDDQTVNDDEISYEMAQVLGELDYESPIVLGGKNVDRFDAPIFKRLMPGYETTHQGIDPTCYYTDFKHDTHVPTLEVIVRRLQVMQRNVYLGNMHDARYDVYHTALAIWKMANR